MENIKTAVSPDGKTLTVTVDLTQGGVTSASGKSVVIASSRGNAEIPGTDLKLGFNLYRPVPKSSK